MIQPDKICVLGTLLTATDYIGAGEEIMRLAHRNRPGMVAAANTHLITAARINPEFGKVLSRFDLIFPDGMPLIWAMNRKGAGLKERVYGPYMMEHVLRMTPAPWKHFFFGGKPETLQQLIQRARNIQPNLDVCGAHSPPFRPWNQEDEEEFARLISQAKPDFVWVALGGEKQETWIAHCIQRHERGVFLAVGDAFTLLAGERSFAPRWMQNSGLTWLYRLMQEPQRLFWRYFKYNSLFLWYYFVDMLKGKLGLSA
jgi:N-acetylglucosaminyldiphosphoundecaprenol N-acetyl-beta-D-mannosaminyltransferase